MAPAVLVTGASGYVGRLLIDALAQRRDELAALVALDVVEPGERLDGVIYVQRDICRAGLSDLLRAHGIDTIVHLASILRPPKHAPPDFAHRIDVLGTQNVLTACAEADVRRLVVASSGAAYGYHPDNPAWLEETDPLRGNDAFEYSKHKRLVETMLAQWRRDHPELNQVVFRPGTIIGAGVRTPVTALFEQPFVLGVRGSASPFVFVWDGDFVRCLVDAVFSQKTGVFNVAGDGALTARQIARILGKPYLPVPAPLLAAALWLLRKFGLSQAGPEQVVFLRYRPVLCNRRLKSEFGYTPKLTSREAFESYAKAAHGAR